MRSKNKWLVQGLVVAALTCGASTAMAAGDKDGARFRGGIAGGGGGIFIGDFALGLGGIDGRLGAQIMDLIGVYAEPFFWIGGGEYGGGTGITGGAGGNVLIDFTFIDQIFVGAGGGGGIIGSVPVGDIHIRAGGYPVIGFGEDGIRRQGLMLGLDLRIYIAGGYGALVSPMASIGYEAF